MPSNLSTTINELGKKLLQAAQDGEVEEIRRLLAKGAPFTADWVIILITLTKKTIFHIFLFILVGYQPFALGCTKQPP